jgi:hypothetical protein
LFLKQHFSNQQSYKRNKAHIAAARDTCGKGKNIAINDIWNFGSSDEADDETCDGLYGVGNEVDDKVGNEVGSEASAGSGNKDV